MSFSSILAVLLLPTHIRGASPQFRCEHPSSRKQICTTFRIPATIQEFGFHSVSIVNHVIPAVIPRNQATPAEIQVMTCLVGISYLLTVVWICLGRGGRFGFRFLSWSCTVSRQSADFMTGMSHTHRHKCTETWGVI